MPRKVKRQIWWNVQSGRDPEEHNYLFLIINGETEIFRIRQKLIEQLQPIVEGPNVVTEGQLGRGIVYRLLSLSSTQKSDKLNWDNVYEGEVTRTRDLYERKSPDGLARYIDQRIEKFAEE